MKTTTQSTLYTMQMVANMRPNRLCGAEQHRIISKQCRELGLGEPSLGLVRRLDRTPMTKLRTKYQALLKVLRPAQLAGC